MKIRLIGSADLVRAWGKELEAVYGIIDERQAAAIVKPTGTARRAVGARRSPAYQVIAAQDLVRLYATTPHEPKNRRLPRRRRLPSACE